MAAAQDTLPVPEDTRPVPGLVKEPDLITRAALWSDRHLGNGEVSNGFYIDFGKMIPGAGWISGGPGYRQWFGDDALLADGSVAISWHGYKMAQARVEMPRLARSRVSAGVQARWLDFGHVDHFGIGPDTVKEARTEFGIRATQVAGYAVARPLRWLSLGVETGLLDPALKAGSFGVPAMPADQPSFMPTEISIVADTRNFPEHPTRGALVRGVATHFADPSGGAATFRRYEADAAGFVPMAGERIVLALRGWVVGTDTAPGREAPFYLLPSLGGSKTLRSFANYRFRDRHLAMATAEVRVALMTHLDAAVFADAGNVAPVFADLNFNRRSVGAGLRLHTRRHTFAVLDVAHGAEGWRVLARLSDPLALTRGTRRAMAVPFVP